MNNLPAGLIASSSVIQAHDSERVIDAVLIGVDLGPNLSISGSLAITLWLNAIRHEGGDLNFMTLLRVGAVVMLPTLALRCSPGYPWVSSCITIERPLMREQRPFSSELRVTVPGRTEPDGGRCSMHPTHQGRSTW